MALDDLRKKVIYQNSVDVWIGACQEKSKRWNQPEDYKKFIEYLQNQKISMKKFPLCVSESETIDSEKMKFTETLSESQDPGMSTYTIKLNDSTLEVIRNFELNN
ncbi:MAG: hypothetical protein R3237_01375 [Nitrosopumilaceae archaeon]|nr:hypothetical protein [Nitrosopumilaceae archaeon]